MKDESLQNLLARLMVGGVIVAVAVMVVGLALYLPVYGDRPQGDKIFSGEPSFLRAVGEMANVAAHPGEVGHRRAILQIGVLLLLLNPVVRVLFAGIGFALQNDRLYVIVSLLVLAALAVGFYW